MDFGTRKHHRVTGSVCDTGSHIYIYIDVSIPHLYGVIAALGRREKHNHIKFGAMLPKPIKF